MLTIDDIRRLVDPEGYKRAMTEHRKVLQGRLAELLLNYDLLSNNPLLEGKDGGEDADEMARAGKKTLARLEGNMREIAWAIEEIDRRLSGSDAALMGKIAVTKAERKGNHK